MSPIITKTWVVREWRNDAGRPAYEIWRRMTLDLIRPQSLADYMTGSLPTWTTTDPATCGAEQQLA